MNLGLPEWIIILAIMLLLFGHRLPAVARSLGASLKEFKKGVHEADEDPGKPSLPASK